MSVIELNSFGNVGFGITRTLVFTKLDGEEILNNTVNSDERR